MFAIALTAVLLCPQEPGKKPEPKKPPESKVSESKTPESKIKVWDDKQAKAAVAIFKKASKTKRGKKLSMAQRMENVDKLAEGRNNQLVKPLAEVVVKDRAITIKRAAAKALGHQPEKTARAAIIKLLGDKKNRLDPQVKAELVVALDKSGYQAKDWKLLERLFGTEFSEKRSKLQKNIFILAKNHREKQALNLLCEHIGEPGLDIVDVDGGSNPPAEYWKARWHAWRVWREDAKAAMFEITGQRFSTKREAKIWIQKNRKKLR